MSLHKNNSDNNDDEPTFNNDKISIDSLISVLDSAVTVHEKRSPVTEHELMNMTLHKIKDKLLAGKPKLLKQNNTTTTKNRNVLEEYFFCLSYFL